MLAHVRKFLISTDFNTEVELGNLGVKCKKKVASAKAKAAPTPDDVDPTVVTAADLERVKTFNERSFTPDEKGKDNLRLYIQVDTNGITFGLVRILVDVDVVDVDLVDVDFR